MSSFIHGAITTEPTGVTPLGDAVLAELTTGTKLTVIAGKTFLATQADHPGVQMAVIANSAVFNSLGALSAAIPATVAGQAKRKACVLARIAVRAMQFV